MFDSPLEWCAVCSNWIAIDQTVVECARQYGCVAAPAAAPSPESAAAAG
jgi:hypothetical protein